MNDDRSPADPDQPPDSDDTALGADPGADTDGGKMDQYDDAVIAADDTGMLAGERLITTMELEQGS